MSDLDHLLSEVSSTLAPNDYSAVAENLSAFADGYEDYGGGPVQLNMIAPSDQ